MVVGFAGESVCPAMTIPEFEMEYEMPFMTPEGLRLLGGPFEVPVGPDPSFGLPPEPPEPPEPPDPEPPEPEPPEPPEFEEPPFELDGPGIGMNVPPMLTPSGPIATT